MVCGDNRPRKTLVQLTVRTDAKPASDAVVVTRKDAKPRVEPVQRVMAPIDSGDFHCNQCDLNLTHRDREYYHRCPGPKPIVYQIERQAKCDVCMFAENGVCIEFQSRHPDRPALIEVGVRRARAACPIGQWANLEADCGSCGRNNFNATGLVSCRYCGSLFANNGGVNDDTNTSSVTLRNNQPAVTPE